MSSVVYGTRGSGKSTFGRRIAEQVAGYGQRFCAIDPTGAWWGLKSSESGTDVGLPVVIFGGDHADVPLEPGAGAELADIVAEIDQSVILDLELLSKGRQIVFIGAFLERLYHINREPLLLLMDEAQRYAPQKPMSPDATKTLGATEDVVKLGRKHGLGSVVFTQRGSGLNKEVSELGDVLIAFRTPGVLDQKRVKEWLDANATEDQAKQVLAAISGLPTGTAIFASNHPDLKLDGIFEIERPRTFDSSSTPQVGQKRKEPRVLSKPDLDALNVRMAAAVERAKADDPKELRRQIAELERSLKDLQARPAEPIEKIVEKVVERPVWPKELEDKINDDIRKMRELIVQIDAIASSTSSRMSSEHLRLGIPVAAREELRQALKGKTTAELGELFRREVEKRESKPMRLAVGGRSDAHPNNGGVRHEGVVYEGDPITKLTAAERRFLVVLATYGQMSRERLAMLAGYKITSGHISNTLSLLRTKGLVEGAKEISITEAGEAIVGDEIEALPKPG